MLEMSAWLGGYMPVMAEELCARKAGKPATPEAAIRHKEGSVRGADKSDGVGNFPKRTVKA